MALICLPRECFCPGNLTVPKSLSNHLTRHHIPRLFSQQSHLFRREIPLCLEILGTPSLRSGFVDSHMLV